MSKTRVAVVIATTGRPTEVEHLLDGLDRQTIAPSRIVISAADERDLPPRASDRADVVLGPKGLPAQRNRGMATVLADSDIIAFFDDDYVPSVAVIEGVIKAFADNPDVVAAGGRLLADGITSEGVTYEDALAMLKAHDDAPLTEGRIEREMNSMYGCNMAFRTSAIGDTRFDETLPLYGWQEDVDFAAQLKDRGRLVGTSYFVGVHRGVKGGRTSGVKLGYSQIANPVYLMRKGTMTPKHALTLMARNIAMNHLRSIAPEPWIDRFGRARGNWIAFVDFVSGKLQPGRILQLK
ncbi:glycosyltransferase [bacterium]|nr:glycosyltransferase [bacterium]